MSSPRIYDGGVLVAIVVLLVILGIIFVGFGVFNGIGGSSGGGSDHHHDHC